MENLIEEINITEIKPNKNNPRYISEEQLIKLKNSIKEFPEMLKLRPLIINNKNEVLGGNMRLKACIELNFKKIPIIRANKLTSKQQKEFIIKDNIAFGNWDWEILSNDWQNEKLEEWGLNGFDFNRNEQTESFSEDLIEDGQGIEQSNQVVITLTMPTHTYDYLDTKINALIRKNPEIICKVQN